MPPVPQGRSGRDTAGAGGRTIHAVADLNEILRTLIEDSLPSLWVQGEISNFSKPSSGHWYFTLKDERAQIRCAMFRNANLYIRPLPQNGDAVLVRAKAGVYPARGELQLIVEYLEPAGTGALLRAYEELKQKLAAEGLFDAKLKRPIPPVPRRIGLITSATGAAVHDVLTTLARRWPLAEVLLYPVPVQGAEAPMALVKALSRLPELAAASGSLDVILLVRGGGSIEDLWAFNSEALARAIRACAVPVIAGVGHEVDVTIADFAADLRAATPTAAAELATPDIAKRVEHIGAQFYSLTYAIAQRLGGMAEDVSRRDARLQLTHPGRRLHERAQRLDELEARLRRCLRLHLNGHGSRISALDERIARLNPQLGIRLDRRALNSLAARLQAGWRARLAERASHLAHSEALLRSFNPEAVLERGYAIVRNAEGDVLRDAAAARAGQIVGIQLAKGSIEAQVRQVSATD